MKFKDTPMNAFIRRAYCDSCGNELHATGQTIKTEFEHRCACDERVWLDERYPQVIQLERE